MAEITNLNRYRKQKARDDKRRQGDENAARFGRNAVARAADEQDVLRQNRHLDAHRRDEPARDDVVRDD